MLVRIMRKQPSLNTMSVHRGFGVRWAPRSPRSNPPLAHVSVLLRRKRDPRHSTMLRPTRESTEPSFVVDGRYRLGRLVHRSDAASVYEAVHRNGASAWIKLAASPAHAHLFDVEVALAKTHASALGVRDDGITEDGLPYLVINPLMGRSLAQRMRAVLPHDRLRSAKEVVRVGAALVRAIAVLHHEGYALGALDARSVFVTEEREIMLLDFSCVSELSPTNAAVDASLVNSLVQSMLATLPQHERNVAARAPNYTRGGKSLPPSGLPCSCAHGSLSPRAPCLPRRPAVSP